MYGWGQSKSKRKSVCVKRDLKKISVGLVLSQGKKWSYSHFYEVISISYLMMGSYLPVSGVVVVVKDGKKNFKKSLDLHGIIGFFLWIYKATLAFFYILIKNPDWKFSTLDSTPIYYMKVRRSRTPLTKTSFGRAFPHNVFAKGLLLQKYMMIDL